MVRQTEIYYFLKVLFSGDFDDDIYFEYGTNTEAYGSCSASLNDRMFILGGTNRKRQVNIELTHY